MEKTGYTEERPGTKSSTRLVFIVGTFTSLALAGYMIYTEAGSPIEIATATTMLIGALGGVKFFGTKNEEVKNEENKNG